MMDVQNGARRLQSGERLVLYFTNQLTCSQVIIKVFIFHTSAFFVSLILLFIQDTGHWAETTAALQLRVFAQDHISYRTADHWMTASVSITPELFQTRRA